MSGIGHILTVLIVQPIFNLLVLIMALLPSHNFGMAIIVFTVVVRLLMWPLVKKQLHQTRAMQKLQPDIKRIKKAAAGDRQKESRLLMELYKERGINPAASLGTVLLQLPIFIGLYLSVRKIATDPQEIINFSYSWLHNLPWLKELSADISKFDGTLFGVVDLLRHPLGPQGAYIPGIVIAALAGAAQFFQSKQLMPQSGEKRSLRSILGDANRGKSADQQEVNAAAQRSMIYFIPLMVFVFALSFPTALPLYWLVNSLMAIGQQGRVLASDERELEAIADRPDDQQITKKSAKNKAKNRRKHSKAKRR